MKRRNVLIVLSLLGIASDSLANKTVMFQNLANYESRAQDIVIVESDHGTMLMSRDDLACFYPSIKVIRTLKGHSKLGVMTIATRYDMVPGKCYLVTSNNGNSDAVHPHITVFATGQLSAMKLPDDFDLKSLDGKSLDAQLRALFAARIAGIEKEQKALKDESAILSTAIAGH